ncbi:hypothetical protein L7F22_022371 [Adiantum nelumboides]|nr:hypothetical protein [Adiantum nelumboides]
MILRNFDLGPRRKLATNIFVTGPTYQYPHFDTRLMRSIQSTQPVDMGVRVIHAKDVRFDAWRAWPSGPRRRLTSSEGCPFQSRSGWKRARTGSRIIASLRLCSREGWTVHARLFTVAPAPKSSAMEEAGISPLVHILSQHMLRIHH